jgi:HSP20 family protein
MARGKELSRYQGESEHNLTPFSFMRRMMDDIDRVFGGYGSIGEGLTLTQNAWSPQVEVFEKNGNLVVRADLPGLDRKDIKVNVDDGALTIEGERRTEHEEKREGFFHSERSYGSFTRRIPLPRGVDASGCDARFDNGVLEVTLKMPKQQSARSVEVKSGSPPAPPSTSKPH